MSRDEIRKRAEFMACSIGIAGLPFETAVSPDLVSMFESELIRVYDAAIDAAIAYAQEEEHDGLRAMKLGGKGE